MKGKWLVSLVLVIALSGGTTVLAHGGGGSGGNSQSADSMAGMDMSGKDKNMDMSGSGKSNSMASMNMSGKDKNMDMSGSGKDSNMAGMDMGEGQFKDTPANIKILGTYGAVNLSFILIGVWSKWFRRKDDSNGNSKQ